MKQQLLILLLITTTGCPAYDPPPEGNDVFIQNQTGDFVYVTDTLPLTGTIDLYDTFSVNSKMFVAAKPNCIPRYTDWRYFFTESHYRWMKQRGMDSIIFYFIAPENHHRTYEEIRAQRLYTLAGMPITEAREKSINHIFYYKDSIEVTHQFLFETRYK
jgi:hypothetical protein